MPNYFQPEIETASPEEIRKIQNEKIVKQVSMFTKMSLITKI